MLYAIPELVIRLLMAELEQYAVLIRGKKLPGRFIDKFHDGIES